MNRIAELTLKKFRSQLNKQSLFNALRNKYGSSGEVNNYLVNHFENSINIFSSQIEQEMLVSDILPGFGPDELCKVLNSQYLKSQVNFISDNIIAEKIPIYSVNDGVATSTLYEREKKTADELLDAWKHRPASLGGVQLREDPSALPNHPLQGEKREGWEGGITFCDQSHIGTSNHIDTLTNDKYIMSLNRYANPHEISRLGNRDAANDQRLLGRRVFRAGADGVENAIPFYERHARYHERDIAETLSNAQQYESHVRGYDNAELYERVDVRRQAKNNVIDQGPRFEWKPVDTDSY